MQRAHRPQGPAASAPTLLLLGLVAAGVCCGGRADLAPLLEPAALSGSREAGRLEVQVSNLGKGRARATTTSIAFSTFEVRLPTRPLAPGETTLVSTALPEPCLRASCDFRVWVDSKDEVRERDENNNLLSARCP